MCEYVCVCVVMMKTMTIMCLCCWYTYIHENPVCLLNDLQVFDGLVTYKITINPVSGVR